MKALKRREAPDKSLAKNSGLVSRNPTHFSSAYDSFHTDTRQQ